MQDLVTEVVTTLKSRYKAEFYSYLYLSLEIHRKTDNRFITQLLTTVDGFSYFLHGHTVALSH